MTGQWNTPPGSPGTGQGKSEASLAIQPSEASQPGQPGQPAKPAKPSSQVSQPSQAPDNSLELPSVPNPHSGVILGKLLQSAGRRDTLLLWDHMASHPQSQSEGSYLLAQSEGFLLTRC